MAELNARIIAKASGTASEEPLATDLEVAELAVNTADGKLFTKHTDGSVVTISGGGGGGLPVLPTGGEVLASDGNQWTSLTLPTLLEGGSTAADVLLDFEGGDTPTLNDTGMTSTYPSTDAKFGSSGATFLRSNADYLQGSWPQALGTQTFTLSFWIKTADTDYSNSTSKRIIAPVSGTNLASGFQLMREPDGGGAYTPHPDNAEGAIMLNPGGTLAGYLCSTRTADIADNAWHYVVIQHEGSGVYSCFSDGSLTERRTATAAVDFGDNNGFFLGKRSDNNSNAYFTGSIDNFVIEIGSVLSTGLTVPVPTAPRGQSVDYGAGASIDSLVDVDTTTAVPTDGQVLTWVDADSRWEPAGPQGGGVVDSINGETGVVSLGIQDMDDYAVTSKVYLGEWDQDVGVDFPDQSGEWRNFDDTSDDVWQLCKRNAAGVDYSAELLGLVTGDVVQVSTDSGSTYGISVTLTEDAVYSTGSGGNITISITLSDTDGAKLTGLTAINLRITQPGPPAALAEGDILQWNDADQEFNPAQLPDTIDKATLQAEVAASTDFTDFQSRIAAL